jgi:hypothetical protein
MRKLLSCLLVLLFFVSTTNGVNIQAADISSNPSVGNINELQEMNINNMSDSEFDNFLMNYIKENKMNGVSFDKIKDSLSSIGVSVSEKDMSQKNTRSVRYCGISALDSFYVYSAHRGQDSYYRLYAALSFNSTETQRGSYDVVSLEWDPDYGKYYPNNTDTVNGMSTMDGSNRSNGIYLFNFNDLMFQAGNSTWAAVYVTPKRSGTLEYGSKYVHTYEKTNISWTIGQNISYQSGGNTGGYTYSISGTPASYSWSTYTDNALTY